MSRRQDLRKMDKKKRGFILVWLWCGLFFLSATSPVTAGDCRYGSVHAWFVASGGANENATARPVLIRGEVFEVQVKVTAQTSLQRFYVKLHEFGTPVYEVLAGPTVLEQLLECRGPVLRNQTFSYSWTMRVRPETSWVNGYAPLEMFVQFNVDDAESCVVAFDVILGYLTDADGNGSVPPQETENRPSQSTGGKNMPGFSCIEVVAAGVVLSGLLIKKRK